MAFIYLFLCMLMMSCIPKPMDITRPAESNVFEANVSGRPSKPYALFATLGTPILGGLGYVGARAYKEIAFIQEADSLLEQIKAYIAQIPSERSEIRQNALLQKKMRLSKRIQRWLQFPITSPALANRLKQLDQYKRLPHGMGTHHTRMAHMRYKISIHFLPNRKKIREFKNYRILLKHKDQSIQNTMAEVERLNDAIVSLTTYDDAARLLFERATSILNDPSLPKSPMDGLDLESLKRRFQWELTGRLNELFLAVPSVQEDIEELSKEIGLLRKEIDRQVDIDTHHREADVAIQSFGLQLLQQYPIALDNLEAWLNTQASKSTVQYLTLKGSNGNHAILMATDPASHRYRLFDPNEGIYLWTSQEQFVQDVYTYLARIGLELPNKNDAFLNRDLDLRNAMEVDFSQSVIFSPLEEEALVGTGLCQALSLQVAQYLLQHPPTNKLSRDNLGIQDIYTPGYFELKIIHYRTMGMPEKELAMLAYWFKAQKAIAFDHAELWKIYKQITRQFVLDIKDAGKIPDLYMQLTGEIMPKFNSIHIVSNASYRNLKRMLKLVKNIFDKYKKSDDTWKERELKQVFSWLGIATKKHVYRKPTGGKDKVEYQKLRASELGLP